MVSSTGLLPIVSGIGLAALAGATSNDKGGSPRKRSALLDFVVLLLGFAIVGAALLVLGGSIETGRRLSPGDAKAENRLVVALFLLLGFTAARRAWASLQSDPLEPWDHGWLDRAPQILAFSFATIFVVLVGVGLDVGLIAMGAIHGGAVVYVGLALAAASLIALAAMRLIGASNPSPLAFARSRHQQLRLLTALENSEGAWEPVWVRPADELQPSRPLCATIWITDRGSFWRSDDGYALARYHAWAATHVSAPSDALHAHRLSFFAGSRPDGMRGLRLTRTSRRWLWWMDAIREHRRQAASDADCSPAERAAGLVFVADHQLRDAGLKLIRPD
jgi:hypothetical protein